jgi:acetyl esterase/lipase
MPIGYLITMGLMATVVSLAVSRHRPRRSSPFRLSHAFGFVLNWPLVVFLVIAASTAVAIAQSGAGLGFWIGFGLAVLASAGLVPLRRRARKTGPAIERALDEGLGSGWREEVDTELAARLRRRPSLVRILLAPISFRRHGVERIANIRYGPAGRGNQLDLYRHRSDRSSRPTLIYLHGGAFRFGSKRFGARHLLYRLASHGWVCLSANYRLGVRFPDPLIDVKKVIAWLREHGREYGVDPTATFLAGSSAGGHLASLAALTPNDPVFQPGFEGANTSVAGTISLYGYYGPVASGKPPSSPLAYVRTDAPPCFVVHGDQDALVIVEDARHFVEQLRDTSSNPVVYAELPGAQHGFDLFRSRRFETVVDAIEAFATHVRSRRRAADPAPEPVRATLAASSSGATTSREARCRERPDAAQAMYLKSSRKDGTAG